MKFSSRAFGQPFTGFGIDSFQLATSLPAFQGAAFGYSLMGLSVTAALGIKLILQNFNVYPLSSSILAAIATCLNELVIFDDLNLYQERKTLWIRPVTTLNSAANH